MKRHSAILCVAAPVLAVGTVSLAVSPPTQAATPIVQDTSQGANVGQVDFSANWHRCTHNCAKAPDNSFRWTAAAGSSATLRFNGTQVTVFGVKEPWANIATVSIDGGPAVDVDFYAHQATATTVAVYTSPTLAAGNHTLVLTMTSRRNPASSGGSAITFDRAEVRGAAAPTTTTTGDASRPAPTTRATLIPMSSPPPSSAPPPPPLSSSSSAPPPPASAPSFWLSGGSRDTNTQRAAVEWANMRGRAVTLVTVYTTRDAGWEAFVSSHATSGQPAAYDSSVTLLIQTPPFPVGSTYAALVSGGYDSQWQRVGTLLRNKVNQGYPAPIVSIGWEFNGSYMYWGGCGGPEKYSGPAQYIAGYRRVVEQLRVTYPQVQTAWVINAHGTPACTGSTNSAAFYPGDRWVTYIGTDDYDHYPPAHTLAAFEARANNPDGLYWIANMARSHGKQVIVPEWGVATGSGSNGAGDNANYITWIHSTFDRWFHEYITVAGVRVPLLKAEFYFADPCGGGNVDSDLIACNPNSRARYAALW